MNAMLATINLNSILLALIASLIGGVFVALVKRQPVLKKLSDAREANLLSERAKEMEGMRKRIEKLEADTKEKDANHTAEKDALRKEFEAIIALYRHRTNNIDASFNALLLLLKKGVTVSEAVEAVEKMRSEQLRREAVEAATMRAAGINAGFGPEDLS